MPLFKFDLESFTAVTIDAVDESAARLALGAVLKALRESEYAIGEARQVGPGTKSPRAAGRPASARRKLGAMLLLKAEGVSVSEIARRLRVSRGSVHRALNWAVAQGG